MCFPNDVLVTAATLVCCQIEHKEVAAIASSVTVRYIGVRPAAERYYTKVVTIVASYIHELFHSVFLGAVSPRKLAAVGRLRIIYCQYLVSTG